jgi:FkbM family methyltransferase
MSTIETFSTLCGTFAVDTKKDAKVAQPLQQGECHQKEVIDMLSAFLEKGGAAVDVGAHIGTISIPLAVQGANVVSFEPNPEVFALLEKNATLNGVVIDARKRGLGAKRGRAILNEGGKGNAGSRSLTEGDGDIEVSLLDDEVERADVIKLDVEGMELMVLRGAEKLLRRSQPVLLLEINPLQMRTYDISSRSIDSFLRAHGYRLFLSIPTEGKTVLGEIGSLPLVTILKNPSLLFSTRRSGIFDIVAIPHGRTIPFQTFSLTRTLLAITRDKISDLIRRYLS